MNDDDDIEYLTPKKTALKLGRHLHFRGRFGAILA